MPCCGGSDVGQASWPVFCVLPGAPIPGCFALFERSASACKLAALTSCECLNAASYSKGTQRVPSESNEVAGTSRPCFSVHRRSDGSAIIGNDRIAARGYLARSRRTCALPEKRTKGTLYTLGQTHGRGPQSLDYGSPALRKSAYRFWGLSPLSAVIRSDGRGSVSDSARFQRLTEPRPLERSPRGGTPKSVKHPFANQQHTMKQASGVY
jgi:hypothetical protein